MRKRKLIAFLNAFSKGISGGDVFFIELAKRMNEYDKVIVTSLLGKQACQSRQVNANYLLTTKEKEFRNVIYTYLIRIIKSLFLRIKKVNNSL